MFKKILVATDLSDVAECVLNALGGMKQFGTQDARLVYCLNARDVGGVVHHLVELAQPALNRQQKILVAQGLSAEAKMVIGQPHDELERQAKEHGCNLIAVASHGAQVSSDILMGGVCGALIHSASLPLLLMRLSCKGEAAAIACDAWRREPLRHILFATDFSDNAEHAYETGVRPLAARGAREVTLLHVQDRARIDRHLKDKLAEFNRIDTERLERLKSELTADGAERVNIKVPYGSPKKAVIDRINKSDISLVVMGSQGRGYVGEIFLGSVSHAVARHASAPVLLIPALG